MKSPNVNDPLGHNVTQTLARRNTPLSTAAPVSFPNQSQWSPGDIGTLVFGCIASVLGILTLWTTFWLGRRYTLRVSENGLYLGKIVMKLLIDCEQMNALSWGQATEVHRSSLSPMSETRRTCGEKFLDGRKELCKVGSMPVEVAARSASDSRRTSLKKRYLLIPCIAIDSVAILGQ